ncbi:MAG: type II secretion system inner membrane protein GspF [Burkholderiaceae bacterium]
MAAFRFEAVNASGGAQRGVLEADSARAARGQLRGQGLIPITVEPAIQDSQSRRRTFRLTSRLSLREQALFTRQFASLLVAGLPLDEALSVLTEQAERDYVGDLLATIRAEVMGGQSLAGALSMHPRDFPDLYRALIGAGEHTGNLGVVMERLADYLDERAALRQKIILAFTYPAIVTVVALGIVTLLLTYVVPQVVSVFTNTKQQLPILTILMLWLSAFVRSYGLFIALILIVGAVFAVRLLRLPGPRMTWDRWLLRAPLIGRLVRDYNTVRFVSTLAILSAAAVPILRALQVAGETLSNTLMRRNVDDAIVRVSEGAPLSRALGSAKTFPPALIHLVRSGEATGNVSQMLERAAAAGALELERRTLLLTSLLEPMLILCMGGIVLCIVLAVMMPIIEINQLVH